MRLLILIGNMYLSGTWLWTDMKLMHVQIMNSAGINNMNIVGICYE